MKKIILSLALSLAMATSAFAAKAKPGVTQVQMADGTFVSAMLMGDEHFHYYTLLDGTPLEKNISGKYERITKETLNARRTAIQTSQTRASNIGTSSPKYFPHVGTPKALVILVQFQDVKFKSTDPVATFNHYLNGAKGEAAPTANATAYISDETHTNYGSVRQYFHDTSEGLFTPSFDVVGPVTISQNSAYYGADNGNQTDVNYGQMISEACAQVEDQVDFSQYDSDDDGYVDLLYVIYAGYSQSISGNSDDCLWPKSGSSTFYLYDKNGNKVSPQTYLAYNGKRISRFGINNELNDTPNTTKEGELFHLNGIGLFCHEFSHTMGLPDHYPVSNNSSYCDNQSPEYWDLMDAGEYTADGYRPTPYTPWEKMLMGWQQPVLLDGTFAQQVTLEPYDVASKAYKIEADVDDNNFKINENYYNSTQLSATEKARLKERAQGEFLLLQNIRNEGWYKDLPGYGLLVWRIDYADKSTVQVYDYPNDTKGIPRVMIVPADGLVINQMNCGDNKPYSWDTYYQSAQNDPFPAYHAGKDNSDITSLTQVEFNWSTLASRPLYNIQKDEATGMVTFDFLKDFTPDGIQQTTTVIDDNRPTEYFDLEGRKVEHPQKNQLYITNQKKKVIL